MEGDIHQRLEGTKDIVLCCVVAERRRKGSQVTTLSQKLKTDRNKRTNISALARDHGSPNLESETCPGVAPCG
jgi:hypothetical protein